MREGLNGLTARGRAFLAAGVTAVVCAIVLGQPTLTRVGVLLVALPLLTAYLVGRSRYRLALTRTVSPQLVSAGQRATVRLELTNEGRTPTGLLLLEDRLPYALGTRPRFVLEVMSLGWQRQMEYVVRSDLRGRFEIGPMSVRVSDPFGLVELGRTFQTTVPLTVTPRTVPLPVVPLSGAWTGSGDNRPRAFTTGSAEDVTVREYRQGDDLRRVHWRSSARAGELMVRREEQPWQSRATLVLDNRLMAHRGHGAASSLEAAVSAAASIAVHLSQRGFVVRLVTADGEDPGTVWHDRASSQNTAPLLEALSVVEGSRSSHLDASWLGEGGHVGLLVAVLGHLDQHDRPMLRRLVHHGSAPHAIALDVDAWDTRSGPDREVPGAAWLSGFGWRAVGARPDDNLATLWQELGRRSAGGGGVRPFGPDSHDSPDTQGRQGTQDSRGTRVTRVATDVAGG
ncbi:DUF58 domain-containing protein [Nocardioides donggukensis]|uniref:DUF58 domain-containing protein n=1 Tax=Nocardioides donggukensis TaxID=2774019 RepID=A0A927Q0Q4_9ACTN|nr:DUF58 domain-containing protein [Nocardioides donggukensis]MBD8869207.1 DUF58 domain-containing protein [Nocardioides donggukensis]